MHPYPDRSEPVRGSELRDRGAAVRRVDSRGVGHRGGHDAARAGRAAVPRRGDGGVAVVDRPSPRQSVPCGETGDRWPWRSWRAARSGRRCSPPDSCDTPAATASLLLNMELVATVVLAATLFREHLGRQHDRGRAARHRGRGAAGLGAGRVGQPRCAVDRRRVRLLGTRQQRHVADRPGQPATRHVPERASSRAASTSPSAWSITGAGDVNGWSVVGALVVGALGYGASITLWVRGAQQLGAARGQVIFATAPFIGAVLSWVVLSDSIEAVQVIAMGIAAVGVGLSLRSDHLHQHHHHVTVHTHEHDHDDGHHDHAHADGVGRSPQSRPRAPRTRARPPARSRPSPPARPLSWAMWPGRPGHGHPRGR